MENLIINNKFKKVYSGDGPEYFHWRLNFKHPILKGLHITIDERISIWCKAIDTQIPKNVYGDETVIASWKPNKKNLLLALRFCRSNSFMPCSTNSSIPYPSCK